MAIWSDLEVDIIDYLLSRVSRKLAGRVPVSVGRTVHSPEYALFLFLSLPRVNVTKEGKAESDAVPEVKGPAPGRQVR